MLILTRFPGEKIIIGDEGIEVAIIAVQGDKVSIGIKAPRSIPVHREEVYERMRAETSARTPLR